MRREHAQAWASDRSNAAQLVSFCAFAVAAIAKAVDPSTSDEKPQIPVERLQCLDFISDCLLALCVREAEIDEKPVSEFLLAVCLGSSEGLHFFEHLVRLCQLLPESSLYRVLTLLVVLVSSVLSDDEDLAQLVEQFDESEAGGVSFSGFIELVSKIATDYSDPRVVWPAGKLLEVLLARLQLAAEEDAEEEEGEAEQPDERRDT